MKLPPLHFSGGHAAADGRVRASIGSAFNVTTASGSAASAGGLSSLVTLAAVAVAAFLLARKG